MAEVLLTAPVDQKLTRKAVTTFEVRSGGMKVGELFVDVTGLAWKPRNAKRENWKRWKDLERLLS